MLKLIFVGPKFRRRRVKKRAKNGKLRFEKNTSLFKHVHELEKVLGFNMG